MNFLTIIGFVLFIIGFIGDIAVLSGYYSISSTYEIVLCFLVLVIGGVLIPLSVAFDRSDTNKIQNLREEKQ